LRNFKRGAFHLAAQARVPVVPVAIRWAEPTGLSRLYRRKPTMVVSVGEPIEPTMTDPGQDRYIRMELAWRKMNDMISRPTRPTN
ncbi:MAG TPA: glycosyl transferase family 1, partial [Micromonosporaceae bacterium]|nr:glycosyl transferase family 1 [Micromonosporaceae bacterium]